MDKTIPAPSIIKEEECLFQNTQLLSSLEMQRLKEMKKRDCVMLKKILRVLADIFFARKINEKKISLRCVDWFVLNYTKEKGTTLVTPNRVVQAHMLYLSWRRNWKRIVFAPYKREQKIYFFDDPVTKKLVPTTVAQLHYFWFLIQERLFEYILHHFDEIMRKNSSVRQKLRNLRHNAKCSLLPISNPLYLLTPGFF